MRTYLREEVHQEALVRNLESFSRFLSVAATMNAQVTNVAGLSRDAAVSRPTVQGFMDVATDTLIGWKLPAWKAKAKVKEAQHPKFYLFDPGVVRALSGRLREPLDSTERGALLETWVAHELRAAVSYQGIGGDLAYWRLPSGSEIDFIWRRGKHAVGIEVKSTPTWKPGYSRSLRSQKMAKLTRAFGVHGGRERLKDGEVLVLPLAEFFRMLHGDECCGWPSHSINPT